MSDEKPKTADDIVSELREKYASHYYCEDSTRRDGEYPEGFDVIDTRKLADSIEEAVKRERASFDCECAGIAELAAKEEAARHKPAWQALARIGDAIQQKMESSPRSVTEYECAIMNLCMRTFAEQSHRQQLLNEDKVREALAEIAKVADDWERHSNTKAGALDSIYELANAALSALKGGKGDGV